MAKAFELNKQLRYAATYYQDALEELEVAYLKLQVKDKALKNAVELVTLERINGDANLRLAICLLKLNSDTEIEQVKPEKSNSSSKKDKTRQTRIYEKK